ncbi:hypothetical protein ACLMJK_005382 [Lecanora helva]
MAASAASQAPATQTKRPSFGGFPSGGASLFLDRSKAGIRGSTPDSEALASSDDEQDHYHRLHPVTSNPNPKPTRRASWLTEAQQSPIRKGSLGGNGPFSPGSPSSTAPSGDQIPWGNGTSSTSGPSIGRGHSTSTSFAWSNTIWNNDSQKGPPQRLTEVLPSPTSMIPPGSAGIYTEEALRSPPIGQDNLTESSIPFAIPLQPTPKTYRSQSYSVGQLDPESNMLPNNHASYGAYGRPRNGTSYAGLQHRPSRPSMLGDLSHDPSLLGQVQEVEDDEESSDGSDSGVELTKTQARTIEQLAMENAMLRQAAAEHLERENTRQRGQSATNNTNKAPRAKNQSFQQRMHDSVPEEAEYALYDMDDADTARLPKYGGLNGRRSSECVARPGLHHPISAIPENRSIESVKKGHWQSSLGFGGIGEPPQSRRHSFADIPTRQNSIGSSSDHNGQNSIADTGLRPSDRHVSPGGYGDGVVRPTQGEGSEYTQFPRSQSMEEQRLELQHLRDRNFAVSYFSRMEPPSLRNGEGPNPSLSSSNMHQAYLQSQYGRPQQLGHAGRPNQLLYMVTFKAQRADVFYVQEGTGLQVRKGDLVIVEADRGADLGTVATESIPFTDAKELKDKFMQEHYQWLMVFSRHGQNGTVAGPNPNGQPNASNSAIGNIGGSSVQNVAQELPNTELKPKMIKRLAQASELQMLREKEGSEAKAKRVCQQKVVEHRLNMEILEAEFQVDWKKLTFYYFADEYINFNSLVTDLFKIYKTRIWMSAINPASFQTPLGGLQIPGGTSSNGASTLNSDLEQNPGRRHNRQHPLPSSAGSILPSFGPFDNTWSSNRSNNTTNGMGLPQMYGQPFSGHDLDIRQMDQYPLHYRQALPQMLGMNSSFNSPAYGGPSLHHSSSFASRPDSSNEEEADAPEVKQKRPRSSKLGNPSTIPEDDLDEGEDPGYVSNSFDRHHSFLQICSYQGYRQFLAAIKKPSKRQNAAILKHTKAVEEQSQRLHRLLDEKANELTTRNRQLQKSLISYLPNTERSLRMKDAAGVRISSDADPLGPSIQETAQSALSSAKTIITQYRSICQQVEAAREKALARPKYDEEEDRQKLQRIIHDQGEKSKLEIRRLTEEDGDDAEEKPLSKNDQKVWDQFAVSSRQKERKHARKSEQSWAMAAKSACRGIDRLVRDLPEASPLKTAKPASAHISRLQVVPLHVCDDVLILDIMGALKYVEELQKKKQSDVLRFLLRVRCWELRQLNVIHRASRPSRPDKARRLGYKAKQGYVIYRVRVRRGGRKRPVPKGATYGKPTNQGVNQLKYQRSLKSTAEERVGRRCANLRVLNSYWINQDSTYKYFEIILVDPQHKAIRRDPRINWIVKPVHKHRESRGLTATGKKSRGLGRGHKFNKTSAGRRKTWKRHNTESYWRYR